MRLGSAGSELPIDLVSLPLRQCRGEMSRAAVCETPERGVLRDMIALRDIIASHDVTNDGDGKAHT